MPFKCHVDASQYSIGGTLTQTADGSERVIAYFSRKLNEAQNNYSANDRELLGMIEILKHFRCYFEGAEFEVITDNQVLQHFFAEKSLSRREARWLGTLSEFGVFPITLQKGKIHILGDVLSRVNHESKEDELQNISSLFWDPSSETAFQQAQEDYQFFGPIIKYFKENRNHDRYTFRNQTLKLLTGELFVPRKYVKMILKMAHDSPTAGNFAQTKTIAQLSNYYWNKKKKDLKNYTKGCLECQRTKPGNKKKLTDQQILELPNRRWGSI